VRILVRRAGALGDVVLATPVVRWLKQSFPDSQVFVETGYPAVFRNNPHVEAVNCGAPHATFDRIVDLDLAYERRPHMHIVDAYLEQMREASFTPEKGLPSFDIFREFADKRQEMFFDRRSLFRQKNMVAVHAARAGWRNRTLPAATWLAVCTALKEAGMTPILIGTRRDELRGSGILSFHGDDLAAQARLIHNCACFVGSDSGLLHVAGATDAPIVGVFTCARPEYRLPYRGRCAAVVPDLSCVGCLARQSAPATTESCERSDVACITAVSADSIVAAVLGLLDK
jgi:ADP-heptose:LPS heptosyltransferase